MAELKTQPTGDDVDAFISGIEDEQKRKDSQALVDLFRRATGEEPKMWGSSIVGFGDAHYRYESGREGDWFRVGFSPRKRNLSFYLSWGIAEYADLLANLGKHTTGKGCLYVKRLSDVDQTVLEALVQQAAGRPAPDA